ncbi:MAG: ABC transporter permease [Promethearchaeota archaeon]
MVAESLWLAIFTSPFIGSITFLILLHYKKELNRYLLILGFIIPTLLISLIGAILVYLVSTISIGDIIMITLSWYWLLLLLSPFIAIGGYLASGIKSESVNQLSSTIIAIALAMIVSSLLILMAQAYNPNINGIDPGRIESWIRNPMLVVHIILEAFQIILNASFGFDKFHLLLDGNFVNDSDFYKEIGRTLGLATPLIFTALLFAISAKAGLFYIGGEGSVILGGFTGGVVGAFLPAMLPIPLPKEILIFIHLPLAFLCAAVVGALFGAIPGYLRAYIGAHEVITTIMLNPVSYLLVFILVKEFYSPADQPYRTSDIQNTAKLPHLLPGPLGIEFLIAIFLVVFLFFFLTKTTYGLEIRAVGENPTAAEYAGIPVKIRWVQAMALSGAIGALGGAGMSLGYYWFFNPSHPTGVGFDGIAVSVLGFNNPLTIIFVAVLFGVIKNGGEALVTSMNIPKDIISAMRGVIILFAAAPLAFSFFMKRRTQDEDLLVEETDESSLKNNTDLMDKKMDESSNMEDS